MGRFLIEIWLFGGFLAFGSIFRRVFFFYSIFGFWVDFWLLGRVLAIGLIFGRDLAFGWIFGFWVDFSYSLGFLFDFCHLS